MSSTTNITDPTDPTDPTVPTDPTDTTDPIINNPTNTPVDVIINLENIDLSYNMSSPAHTAKRRKKSVKITPDQSSSIQSHSSSSSSSSNSDSTFIDNQSSVNNSCKHSFTNLQRSSPSPPSMINITINASNVNMYNTYHTNTPRCKRKTATYKK